MAGGFAPGKILPSAFPELIRVLRPGGYILWTMRDGFDQSSPDFALFDVKVNALLPQTGKCLEDFYFTGPGLGQG